MPKDETPTRPKARVAFITGNNPVAGDASARTEAGLAKIRLKLKGNKNRARKPAVKA
jgi:hypothetical protein